MPNAPETFGWNGVSITDPGSLLPTYGNIFAKRIVLVVLLVFAYGCAQTEHKCVVEPAKGVVASTATVAAPSTSPYSIAELEEFLLAVYEDVGHDEPIPRWEQEEIKYFLTGVENLQHSPPTWEQQSILRAYFDYYGSIMGKTFVQQRGRITGTDYNIVMISADNFAEVIQMDSVKIPMFGVGKNEKQKKMIEGRITRLLDAGVQQVRLSNKYDIGKHYWHLAEINDYQKNNFSYFSKTAIYRYAFTDPNANTHSKNIVSINNYDRSSAKAENERVKDDDTSSYRMLHSKYKTLYKLDEYLLKALYSDAVKPGMKVSKAVPIMACEAYKHFIYDTPQVPFVFDGETL